MGQSGTDKMSRSGVGLQLKEGSPGSLEAWFLGEKAENADEFERLIVEAIRDQAFWRRNFYPSDPSHITENIKRSEEYASAIDTLRDSYRSLLAFLKKSAPFFSMRYQGHMIYDSTLPALVGYFATMLYNPNNVAFEASTATTLLEMWVADDLCKMLGYAIPEEATIAEGTPRPWGHITCGGTVANIEAVWVARNLKFYPVALQAAVRGEKTLAAARDIAVPLPTGAVKRLLDLDLWELLNLKADDILALPRRLDRECQIDGDTFTAALKGYDLQHLGFGEFCHRFLGELSHMPVLFVPGTKHYSFPKAAAVLGLGEASIINLPTDRDARANMAALETALEGCLQRRQPVYAAVSVIGSTEESAVDPLADLLVLRDRFRARGLDFVIHADAAWGGYLASLIREDEPGTPPPAKPLAAVPLSAYVTKQFEALQHADSITVDPHKSGYIPYPAGALCYRNGAMRDMVTFKAPVIVHGDAEPACGIYGIEGSKPGAAVAAVYLSHKVIRPTKSGYGRIHGQALFSCKRLYARLVSMAFRFVVVIPVPRLPAERYGEDATAQLQFIRERIDRRSNEEILADPEALSLLQELGPDQNILAYAFNVRNLDGRLNSDLARTNRLNRRLYDVLSIKPGEDISGCRLMLSTTDFTSQHYGNEFIQDYKQRLGVGDSPGDTITVLRSTVMDPWLAESAKGSFLDIVEEELRLALSKALSGDALLQVFEDIDTNADGVLDRQEIDAKFQAMGYGAEDTQAFWQFANRNADNNLSRQEFLEHFSQFLVLMSSKPRESQDQGAVAADGMASSPKRGSQHGRCRRVGGGR
jgi:glutamate/tyrosine decarboxylase-like PLP-dependent enzyme